jgi:hypothetical protein
LEAYQDSCELAKKCKDTQVVHITDREGDIFEIFAEYESKKNGEVADYIVRSNHNRTVYPKGKPPNTLIQELEESKLLGEISFDIIKREDNAIRHIRQSVQAISIEIKSRYGADKPNLITTINAIYLKEIGPSEGEKPIIWCLLTSLPINSLEEVMLSVTTYVVGKLKFFLRLIKVGVR